MDRPPDTDDSPGAVSSRERRDACEWLAGGGELGALVRATDWSRTPLGPRDGWPPALRTAAALVVESRSPMALLWGRALVLIYNDAFRPLAAGAHPAALGRSLHDHASAIGPLDVAAAADALARGESLDGPAASGALDRSAKADARLIACYTPVRDADGRVAGLLVTVRHALDRREGGGAEQTLQESADLLRAISDTSGDVIFAKDREGRLRFANPATLALIGKPLAEVLGRTDAEFLSDPAAARAVMENDRRIMASGVAEDVEERVPLPDGTDRIWFSRKSPYRDAAGRVVGLLGISRDITARKRAEEAVRAAEERYRTLFTNMTEGFALGEMICDAAGVPRDFRLLEMNDAFERQTGLDRVRAVGRPMREVLPHLEQSWIDTCGAVALGAPPRRFESYNRDLDRHFSVYCFSPARGRFAVLFTDVSERRRADDALQVANERLVDADRRKDEFLGMLSHELRNPLAPVRNALYVLDRVQPGSHQAARAREIATRQVRHLTRLVDDLLDVTRVARGKIELRRRPIDLAAVTRQAAEDHRALLQDRRLDLQVLLPERPVVVDADETRVAQVLGNLLHNAAKFTPAGGRVGVSVGVEGGQATVRVRDTGAGIPPEVLPSLFEPFSQGKQTLARSEGGLGLGLALVKALVTLHGGRVAAHSAGAGAGTEVVVTLPLAAAVGAGDLHAPAGEAAARARRRVLVVDDNRDAADSLAEIVAMLGHEPVVAYDAFDGLARAAEHLPDVALCDLGLPGMDGFELARRLRALAGDRPLRLVAVSGYAQPEDVASASRAGFDAHVAKPPDPARLEALLE